jgi:hypothetical protein
MGVALRVINVIRDEQPGLLTARMRRAPREDGTKKAKDEIQ